MSIQHTMYHVSIKCITNKKKEEIRNQDLVPDLTKLFVYISFYLQDQMEMAVSHSCNYIIIYCTYVLFNHLSK